MKRGSILFATGAGSRHGQRGESSRHGLDRVIAAREVADEICDALSPQQMVAVVLRMDGLNMQQTADLLGISRNAVSDRLRSARLAVARAYPELLPDIGERRRGRSDYALQYGQCVECGELVHKRSRWCRFCVPKNHQRPLQNKEDVL